MQRITRTLDAAEIRVLGGLMEKEQTTPELYPLTVNSLIQACNQKTAREPVMDMSEGAVHGALRQLFQEGLVLRTEGVRVTRWRHGLDLRWSLDPGRKAVMTLLLLRGPQTPGELRSRSERLHAFASIGELEDALLALAASPEPLIREMPKAPGQKEARWTHLVGGEAAEEPITPAVRRYAADEGEDLVTRIADLNRRVRELERVVSLLTGQPTTGNQELMTNEYKVQCVKLGAELPGLDKPPFSSPLGQRIYASVSKQAWDMWQEESRTIMNHYGLSMADPEARKKLRDSMVMFLFGPEPQN